MQQDFVYNGFYLVLIIIKINKWIMAANMDITKCLTTILFLVKLTAEHKALLQLNQKTLKFYWKTENQAVPNSLISSEY